VRIILRDPLYSIKIAFEVAADVTIDGVAVIREGALAVGRLTESKAAGSSGHSAVLTFAIEQATATDGQSVAVTGTIEKQRNKDVKVQSGGYDLRCRGVTGLHHQGRQVTTRGRGGVSRSRPRGRDTMNGRSFARCFRRYVRSPVLGQAGLKPRRVATHDPRGLKTDGRDQEYVQVREIGLPGRRGLSQPRGHVRSRDDVIGGVNGHGKHHRGNQRGRPGVATLRVASILLQSRDLAWKRRAHQRQSARLTLPEPL
jgi:hypothetical protein